MKYCSTSGHRLKASTTVQYCSTSGHRLKASTAVQYCSTPGHILHTLLLHLTHLDRVELQPASLVEAALGGAGAGEARPVDLGQPGYRQAELILLLFHFLLLLAATHHSFLPLLQPLPTWHFIPCRAQAQESGRQYSRQVQPHSCLGGGSKLMYRCTW